MKYYENFNLQCRTQLNFVLDANFTSTKIIVTHCKNIGFQTAATYRGKIGGLVGETSGLNFMALLTVKFCAYSQPKSYVLY